MYRNVYLEENLILNYKELEYLLIRLKIVNCKINLLEGLKEIYLYVNKIIKV